MIKNYLFVLSPIANLGIENLISRYLKTIQPEELIEYDGQFNCKLAKLVHQFITEFLPLAYSDFVGRVSHQS